MTLSAPTVSGSSFAAYKAIEAINWSTLKHVLTSPLHYQHALVSDEDSGPMRLGRALHALLPTREEFNAEWVVFSGASRRSKEWDAFSASHSDKEILLASEYETVKAMREAVLAHPRALHWIGPIDQGQRELSLRWVDPITGLDCKGRVDWIGRTDVRTDMQTVGARLRRPVEFKSTSAKTLRDFFSQAEKLMYRGQAAYYDTGLRQNNYSDIAPPVLIVVQSCEPHDVWCLPMSAETIAQGRDLYCEALAIVQGCMQTKHWPGATGDGDLPFQRASWVEDEDEPNP